MGFVQDGNELKAAAKFTTESDYFLAPSEGKGF